MRNFDIDARHQLAQLRRNLLQAAHTVADIINAAAAAQLTLQRFLNHAVIIFADIGFDRQSVLRRRLDNAHIAAIDERHMQRARNRRSRQRQNVDAQVPLFDFFLLRHAEALLLVNNQQAKVGELHISLQQAVRTDKDIHLALLQSLQGLALLLRAAEAVEHLDVHAKVMHTLLKRQIMLLRQHCRRCQHRNLLAVHHSLKSRTNRHFGLAIANVAAQKALHRLRLFHICLDFGNRLKLVRRFLIREGLLKLLLHHRIGAERMTRHNLALRIQLQQLLCQLRNRLRRLRRRALPILAAHLRQTRHTALAADILVQHIYLLNRHIQLILASISQKQIIAVYAVDEHILYAHITANAMHLMHNIVTSLDIRKILQLLALIFGMQALALLHTEDIVLRQQQPVCIPEAESVVKVAIGHVNYARLELLHSKAALQLVIAQIVGKAARLDAAGKHNHRRNAVGQPVLQILNKQINIFIIGRHTAHRNIQGRQTAQIAVCQRGNKLHALLCALRQQLILFKQLRSVLLVFLIQLFQHGENVHRLIDNDERFRRTISKNICIISSQRLVHDERRNLHAFERLQAALSIYIKAAHGVQLIVEPFNTHRRIAVNRIDIQNITAQAELSQRVDLLRALITQLDKPCQHSLLLTLLAQLKHQLLARNAARTQLLLLPRLRCNKDDAALLACQNAQRCCTPCLQLQALRIGLHTRQTHRVQLLHRQIRIKIAQLTSVRADFLT